jgi:hypothetical protein
MEGYTDDIHDNISGNATVDLTYIENDNYSQVSWNNRLLSCQKIENFNNIQNLDNNVKEILNIYRDLTLLDTFEIPEDYKDDKEVNEHLEKINKFIELFKTIKDNLLKQNEKTLILQTEYKKMDDKLQDDIQKVSDFKEFALSINTKYKDLDTEKLNQNILEITKKIKDSNNDEIKKKLLKENHILNLYLYKFIKEINSCNNGSTCSLCLQRQVDTFMEPCGHTGCSECIEILKNRSGGEYNCNCFLCRKNVIKFHRLYFT